MFLTKIVIFLQIILIFISCGSDQVTGNRPSKVGSLSRMNIIDDNLYVIEGSSVTSFDITDRENIEFVSSNFVDQGIETIFAMEPYLLIGGQLGVYTYEVDEKGKMSKVSEFPHVRACDPVVSDRRMMFVTLRVRPDCIDQDDETNQLKVIDITNINEPKLVKNYQMESPLGLTFFDDFLFVCDKDTLKVFDKSESDNLKLVNKVNVPNCQDIIYDRDSIIVTSPDKVYQFEFFDDTLNLLSEI